MAGLTVMTSSDFDAHACLTVDNTAGFTDAHACLTADNASGFTDAHACLTADNTAGFTDALIIRDRYITLESSFLLDGVYGIVHDNLDCR
jgi:hypothetical protein